jgi:hypothetical protein
MAHNNLCKTLILIFLLETETSDNMNWQKIEAEHSDKYKYFEKMLFPNELHSSSPCQDCQMVYFQSKNSNLGKYGRALEWKRLVYSTYIWNTYITAIWYILWPFGN